jgi:predicted nucleotide-binding protein
LSFLVALVNAAERRTNVGLSSEEVGESLGLTPSEIEEFENYWTGKGRLEGITLAHVGITPLAVDDVEEIESTAEALPDTEGEEQEMVTVNPKRVFVIHGRNLRAFDAMRDFLRALGLDPWNFDDLVAEIGGSPFIGDVVREGLSKAKAVVALFTPDEYSTLRGDLTAGGADKPVDKARWQARPNVIFEAGMALGIDEEKTILVTLGSDVSLFSDVNGRHIVQLDNGVKSRDRLRAKLEGRGCRVELKSDWTTTGDFEGCSIVASTAAPASPSAVPATSDIPDAAATMKLKAWVTREDDYDITKGPVELAEVERKAGVPSGFAERLSPKWLPEGWSIKEMGGGYVWLEKEPERMVTSERRRGW